MASIKNNIWIIVAVLGISIVALFVSTLLPTDSVVVGEINHSEKEQPEFESSLQPIAETQLNNTKQLGNKAAIQAKNMFDNARKSYTHTI